MSQGVETTDDGAKLTVSPGEISDGGTFKCEVTFSRDGEEIGKAEKEATFNIRKFLQQPEATYSKSYGDSLTLTCKVKAEDGIQIIW